MRLITGPRCSGKTYALIKESAQTKIPIIAPTMMMAEYIRKTAKEIGFDIPDPVSINKIVNQGGRPGKYYIDELAMCLNQLGIDPVVVTACDEEKAVEES